MFFFPFQGQNTNLNSICASPDGSYLYCGSNDGRISIH